MKLYLNQPNPKLKDFVQRHLEEKPYIEEEDIYEIEPFAKDITEGKNDPIYNAHSYHTKVPPKAIEPYILHYTKPGDLILDPFCGSGMTGVAALRTGRKAILIDLSPAAVFIAYNYCTPVDPQAFKEAVNEILKTVQDEISWLYETKCRKCGESACIEYTIWSDVFKHHCGVEFALWDVASNVKIGGDLKEFSCPGCGSIVKKTDLKRIRNEPVRVNYSCLKCRRREDDIRDHDFDIKKLEEIEERWIKKKLWYPDYPMMFKGEKWGVLWRSGYHKGITHVHHFFTLRNLWALSLLWSKINHKNYRELNLLLIQVFLDIIKLASKLRRPTAGQPTHTLYVPSLQKEVNVSRTFENKVSHISKILRGLKSDNGKVIFSNQSATNLFHIPSNSIDYIFTDPPYGSNLIYSELNFLWEAWLGYFTNTKEEAIVNKTQGKGLKEYKELMAKAFNEMYRVLKPGRYLTMVFHNSQKAVWDVIQEGLREAGFEIVTVNVLDKKQRSFKAVTSEGAVGKDVVLNCRKPKKLIQAFATNGVPEETIETTFIAIQEILRETPLDNLEGRTPRHIYSKLVERFGGTVPMDFEKIRRLLGANFKRIDESYYLWEQVPVLSREEPIQGELFKLNINKIKTEFELISWLREYLSEPKEWDEIHPQILKNLDQGHKLTRDFKDILEENFILDEETQKWRLPKEGEEDALKKKQEKRLLKEFEEFFIEFQRNKQLKPSISISAIELGFKNLYSKGEYETISRFGEKLPEELKTKLIKGLIMASKTKI